MKIKKVLPIILGLVLILSFFGEINKKSEVEASGNTIPATKKLYKKYGSKGFNQSKTVSRSELNKIAKAASSNKGIRDVAISVGAGLITSPLSPYLSVPAGVATSIATQALPHSSNQLNSTLKKSSAKKFKLTAHYRFVRHGADKYYVVSHFSAKPI